MPSQSEIISRIEKITREKLDLPSLVGDIGPDTPLFKGGLELDSFNIVELIAELETQLLFEFRESDFKEEHFRTIGALGGLIDRYLNA